MSGLVTFSPSQPQQDVAHAAGNAPAPDDAALAGAFHELLEKSRQAQQPETADEPRDTQAAGARAEPGPVEATAADAANWTEAAEAAKSAAASQQQASRASLSSGGDEQLLAAPALGAQGRHRWSNVAVICAAAAYGGAAAAVQPAAEPSVAARPDAGATTADASEQNDEASAQGGEWMSGGASINFAMAAAWAQTTEQASAFAAASGGNDEDPAATGPADAADAADAGALRTAMPNAPAQASVREVARLQAEGKASQNSETFADESPVGRASDEPAAAIPADGAVGRTRRPLHASLMQHARAEALQQADADRAAVAESAAAEAKDEGHQLASDRAEVEFLAADDADDADDDNASAARSPGDAQASSLSAAAAFAMGAAQAWLEGPAPRGGETTVAASASPAVRALAQAGGDDLPWFAALAGAHQMDDGELNGGLNGDFDDTFELVARAPQGTPDAPAAPTLASAGDLPAVPRPTANGQAGEWADDDADEPLAAGQAAGPFAAAMVPAPAAPQVDSPAAVAQPTASAEAAVPASQVSEELAQAIGYGGRTIRLRVTPPGMGELAVDVRVIGNRVQMAVTGDAQDLASTLRAQAEQLQESLQAQGLQLDSLDFRGGPPGEHASASQQERRSEHESARQTREFERLFGGPVAPADSDAAAASPPRRRGLEQVIYVTA